VTITRLICWIGEHDFQGMESESNRGPIYASLVELMPALQQILLLSNYPIERTQRYIDWLQPQTDAEVVLQWHDEQMIPVDYAAIYLAEKAVLTPLIDDQAQSAVLLSPGTPAMHAVWLLLTQTQFKKVTLLASSLQFGLKQVTLPFQIAAEFTPLSDQQLHSLSDFDAASATHFSDIYAQSHVMQELKQKAAQLAQRSIPVLLLGETGTGKELFATAIHNSSPRADKAFIALNCGSIPPELIDSELFGHEKGSFTGANAQKKGIFEAANGGTVFLDELGELPLDAQVRLLRVFQEKKIRRVGGGAEINVDVRLIAATYRDLALQVMEGKFREDLFYRVSIGVLTIPPLRQREGDLLYLAERLLQRIAKEEQLESKKLSVEAINVILSHPWPGNVRELENTLIRATLWQRGEIITAEDMSQAILLRPQAQNGDGVLGRPLDDNFKVSQVLEEVERHYIERAWQESGQSKKRASKLLGYKDTNQTLTKRMVRYGISEQ